MLKMPETVVLRVLMHCEGCANTVKRACARIPGVAKYTVDYPAQKVTVTGNVNRDQVLKRILKTGKHAEVEPEKSQKQEARKEDKKLVEPKEEKKKLEEPKVQVNKEEKKQEVKKAEAPKEDPHPTMAEVQTMVVQTVILKVVLHCEGCARTVKRAVKRIPGVTAYDVDFPGQKVTVTGVVTPEDVYRHVSRTGKITVLVPPPPPPPPPEVPAKVEEPPKEEPPKEEPPKEEPKAEEAKPEEPKKDEAAVPAVEEKKDELPKEEAKAEEPKKEEEAKKEEAAPPAEEKKEEEKKPEEKPEEKKEEAAAPAAEEKKDEKKEEEKPEPAPEPAPAPAPAPSTPTVEELYPVTFVLGPDYTRYYYY